MNHQKTLVSIPEFDGLRRSYFLPLAGLAMWLATSCASGGDTEAATDGGASATGGNTGQTGSQGGSSGGQGGSTASQGGVPAAYAICRPCHGDNGEGTKNGPEIQHPPRDFANYLIRNGAPGTGFPAPMIAIPTSSVSDADAQAIIAWLWSMSKPSDGQGLYLDFCGRCHGADGRGGTVSETAAGKAATEITTQVRAGHGGTNFANRTKFMPAFSKSDLTDDELKSIETFLNAR